MAVPCLIACMAWWRRSFGAFQLRTPIQSNNNKDGSFIFFRSTTCNHSAPQIMWAHSWSSKNRFGKMSFHQWWCAAVSSSPSLWILWKVSWVICKILLSVSLSRNKEGNYLVHRWVMSPRSQPMVSEIDGWEICSPKVVDLMTGCCRRDIDGVVRCLRWVKVSWWDLSAVLGFPLSSSQLTNHISRHYWSLTQPTHL